MTLPSRRLKRDIVRDLGSDGAGTAGEDNGEEETATAADAANFDDDERPIEAKRFEAA